MKVLPIMQIVLKDFYSDYKRCKFGKCNANNIAIVIDGVRAYFINEADFPFDFEKLVPDYRLTGLDKLVPDMDNYQPAYKSGVMRQITNQSAVMELTNACGSAWIDKNFIKEFSKDAIYHIAKTKPDKSVVMVTENNNVVAMLYPFIIKEV